jgi:hypothetical protein
MLTLICQKNQCEFANQELNKELTSVEGSSVRQVSRLLNTIKDIHYDFFILLPQNPKHNFSLLDRTEVILGLEARGGE